MMNTKKLIILRGLPGSGKSEISWMFWEAMGAVVCSADFYFDDGTGGYEFNPTKLQDAHKSCWNDFEEAIALEASLIVIDNTNTRESEFHHYVNKASQHDYQIHHLIVENRHGSTSSHNVPDATITKMRNRFEVKL